MSQGGNRWERVQGTHWLSQQKCGILVNTVISETALPTITGAGCYPILLDHGAHSLQGESWPRLPSDTGTVYACMLLCVCPEKGDWLGGWKSPSTGWHQESEHHRPTPGTSWTPFQGWLQESHRAAPPTYQLLLHNEFCSSRAWFWVKASARGS